MYSQDSPEPPQFIFWYHNEEEISYDSPRGGVSQITEKGGNTVMLENKVRLSCWNINEGSGLRLDLKEPKSNEIIIL